MCKVWWGLAPSLAFSKAAPQGRAPHREWRRRGGRCVAPCCHIRCPHKPDVGNVKQAWGSGITMCHPSVMCGTFNTFSACKAKNHEASSTFVADITDLQCTLGLWTSRGALARRIALCTRQRPGIISYNPKTTKTYNRKRKPPFNRHLGCLFTNWGRACHWRAGVALGRGGCCRLPPCPPVLWLKGLACTPIDCWSHYQVLGKSARKIIWSPL